MRKWLAAVAVGVAIAAWYFLSASRSADRPRSVAGESSPEKTPAVSVPRSRPETVPASNSLNLPGLADSTPPTIGGLPNAMSGVTISPAVPAVFTNLPAETVMENMRSAFHAYASMLGGNPVGTNPEITAALNGANVRHVNFLREEDGLRINAKGELVDPWETPFFFHQLSARVMEIRSAGPDRVLWTGDDLILK